MHAADRTVTVSDTGPGSQKKPLKKCSFGFIGWRRHAPRQAATSD